MKNNKKLLWDFINNKKTPSNITDYNFYIDAINITNDEELYYHCPIQVQTNYNFILYLVNKFKDNTKFINEISQNYLKNTPRNDYTYQELIFIMSDLVDDLEDVNNYKIRKDIITNLRIKNIKNLLEENNDEEHGLGFIIVLENEESKVIADYLAKIFIAEIFYNIIKLENLEEIIHITYRDRLDLVTYGMDRFVIEAISLFDGYLAYYITENIYLIQDIKKDIKKIMKNWKKYIKDNYSNQLDELEKATKELILKYESSLNIQDIYEYIDNKSPFLPVKLAKDDYENDNILSDKRINIKDYRCLKEALDTAESIFNCQIIKEKKHKGNKAKILEFKPKNKE